MSDQLLNVKISSPKGVIYAGQAYAVSSKNSAGKFDILPQHANFITLIENQPITIILPDRQKKVFTFPFSIIYNSKDFVRIYTDITSAGIAKN